MVKSLKEKTISALLWNFLDKFSQQIIIFIIGIWLARLLTPANYGLIGMLTIFIALAPVFLDSGFSVALMRQEKLNDQDVSTVFYFNVFISLFLYFVLFFSAPLIASFFKHPELVIIARIVFIALIFNSLTIIQTVVFSKQINFRTLTLVNITSTCISGIIAIYLAYKGYGVWSLVAQILSLSAIRMVLLWLLSNWRPKLIFNLQSLRSLLSFSYNLLLANILYNGFLNIYSMLIGRIYPVAQLGFFTQGTKLSDMPVGTLYSTIQNATLPIFSTIQNEKDRLLNAYRKTMRFAAFISFPILFGLALIAHPLISILLKTKWIEVVPFFQLLCIGGIFTVLIAVNQNFIKIKGRSDIILKLEIFKIVLIVVTLILTIKKSILILVLGQIIVRFAAYLSNIIFIGKQIDYSWKKQLWDIFPYFIISILITLPLLKLGSWIENDIVKLSVQVLLASGLYLLINKMLGSKILNDMLNLIFKKQIKE